MAQQVYDRERSLQHNIRTLKGGLLLLLVGAMWGLMVPLTRVISRDTPEPIGASFWLELIAGLLCCAWAAMQGKLSRPSSKTWTFVCVWAILQGGSNVLMFLVAGHLPGIVISIVIALEGFAVFLFAAIMHIEESSLRRLLGLSLGLFGVAALLLASQRADGVSNWIWFAIALGIPMLYGAADLLVAARHPEGLDASFAMGLVLMVAAVFSLPLVLATDQFYFPGLNQGTLLLLGGGVLSAIGNVAYVFLIASTGAVFASQSAYAITAAGIAWSVMLLDESLTLWALGSLVLIIVGLALVGTKNEAGDVEVEFRRKRTRTA
jgi:drug/metabolite transporter (DMT)-like permease